MAKAAKAAYCTLLTSDEYLPGAAVLAHSLRDNGTKRELAVLVTLDTVSATTIDELKTLYDQIIPVDRIVNKSPANLYLMNRPDLGSTFTKIALWRQTQFSHLVYIDADIVSLRAPDELFNLPHTFAAVPDIGWPDCFNSGVLSLKPNMGDYYALLALAQRGISFDGADQGLLNMHFRNWERLSFAYNCTPSGNYQYAPAYRHFQSSISLVHYIGSEKPWIAGREQQNRATGIYEELLGRWWAVYDKHYRATYLDSAQAPPQSRTVQNYVTGEDFGVGYGYPPAIVEPTTDPEHVPEASMTEGSEPHQETEPSGVPEPEPQAQQRDYSTDWDPMRQAPPPESRPEAPNFPSQQYEMSQDPTLFQAPKPPSPPKNLGYELPKNRPTPIFPWEGRAPKPTRVFAEDLPPPPAPAEAPASAQSIGSSTQADSQATTSEPTTTDPSSPTFSSSQSLTGFSTANAWDSVPEINRYISSLPQNRRGKVQVLFNKSTPLSSPPSGSDNPADAITSPTSERPPNHERRSSKITDFPTEIERPSLPVTPAPVSRPSFWGAERDEQGDLPPAEGVPEQSEWDPVVRLLQLRERQADLLNNGPTEGGEARDIPMREHVESAAALKPGQAAELAKLAEMKVVDQDVPITGAAPGASDLAAGVQTEGTTTASQAPGQVEGAGSAEGGRAKDIADALKAEPVPEALAGPAPMTATTGAPGQVA